MITEPAAKSNEFSLVLGGPLFQLLRKIHLAGDGLQLLRRRVLFFALLTWLPLGLLSSLTDTAGVPFYQDLEAHIRFLLVLPLLIAAEPLVHQRLRRIVQQFGERDLVPEGQKARFESAVSSAYRVRNSLLLEVLLLGFVYLVGTTVWRHYIALHTTTWYILPATEGSKLTLAGLWYAYVSLPVTQFFLLRWYFRLLIWTRFLWHVSRIPLKLIPTHPDGFGGLGFIAHSVQAFGLVLLAHGALVSGYLSNRIFFAAARLTDFKEEIALVLAFLMCLVLGPLLLFSPLMQQVKRTGLREYGTLAHRYMLEFDHKWLRGGAPADEHLLGSADIQSLADLGNSFQLVKSMGLVLFTKDSLLMLVGATLLPILPLLATIMPVEDLLRKLVGILL